MKRGLHLSGTAGLPIAAGALFMALVAAVPHPARTAPVSPTLCAVDANTVEQTLFVAPNGNDANSGDQSR